MPSYTIFEKADLPAMEAIESIELVKNEFSWLAFLLPIVWIFIKRLWWVLLAYLVLMAGFSMLELYLPVWSSMLASAIIAFLIALEAPTLQSWSLRQKGYREVTTLYAEDKEHCETRYIEERVRVLGKGDASRPHGYKLPALSQSEKQKLSGTSSATPPVIGLFPSSENA